MGNYYPNTGPIEIKCGGCGFVFRVEQHRANTAHYCSRKCYYSGRYADVEARLMKRVLKAPNGCWEWQGPRRGGKFPYGVIGGGNRSQNAHRVAFRLFKGAIPDGMDVCHHCDNPPCVNPDHLFLGTRRENLEDMVRKGRSLKGKRSNRGVASRVLTDEQVIAIRADTRSNRAIARDYSVTSSSIFCVKHRITYSYIP